jgi:Dolichyl-phosphate-mannose-protein mannosyltransferase
MGAGFMSHIAAFCASVWCFVILTRQRSYKRLWAAGALAGLAFLIRPYTAVALLWPAVLWCLWNRRQEWTRVTLMFLLGLVPGLIFFLLYNELLFGAPLKTGYNLDPSWNEIQFGFSHFRENFVWYVRVLNHSLWGWPFPGLLILFPLLLRRSGWQRDLLLAVCASSLFIAYCFDSYHDIVYSGPRYLFEMVGPLSLLAARSVFSILEFVQKYRIATAAWKLFVFLLIFFPLVIRLPQEIRYHSQIYHGQTNEVIHRVNKSDIGKNALIFISGDPYIFRSFFFENALVPSSGNRVFVRDLVALRNEITEAFPRPEVWRVTVKLQPLPGPNNYSDHFLLKEFKLDRLK